MTEKSDILALLKRLVDNPDAEFRAGQWEAIDAIVNRNEKRLVVERTGWGKSSVYFISTHILRQKGRGLTLIISPLLALMRNQIEAAERLKLRAKTINSGNRKEWNDVQAEIEADKVDVLLISPERLANEGFIDEVLLPVAQNIGLLVVDEAHCISDWGYDFRPNYRRLVNVLKYMPVNMPILGTTATANNRVVEDIKSQIGDIEVQRGSLMRDSLELQTLVLPTRAQRLSWLSQNIEQMPGTGIIYTLTTTDAEQVAEWLRSNGTNAYAYHGSILDENFENTDVYREYLEGLLLNDEIKVLVATTALGMGYDKPNLGFVIHYQAPGSIITYYQQVGRAGRAIDRAYGILMSGSEDGEIQKYFRNAAFPRPSWVHDILELLEENDGLTVSEIENRLNLRNKQIEQTLTYLAVENPSPVIKQNKRWSRTPVEYKMDTDTIERLTAQRVTEWEEIQSYISETGCLMEYLARNLDDKNPMPCGKCASCIKKPIIDTTLKHQTGMRAVEFLKHSEMPFKCKVRIPKGAFKAYGFSGNLKSELKAEAGKVLSRWGDAGWGEIVKQDKYKGAFSDALVDAVVDMVKNRWDLEAPAQWVTCVPSENHPTLVPDFAQQVAERLGLPFQPVVTKVKINQPQKTQQNKFYQCQNLDGAFKVGELTHKGPVLLIDDVVDSGWTLTVIAALLRQAGSGPVLPLALATASIGG